jgi:PAS domain-containing protein
LNRQGKSGFALLFLPGNTRRTDGSQIWIEGDCICLYDQVGWIVGHFGIRRDITARVQAEEKGKKLIVELQATLAETKTLRGIFHICAFCKKIRGDEG